MLDLNVGYNSAVATGTTLAELTEVTPDLLDVKTLPAAMLKGIIQKGANCQRLRITSPNLSPDPGIDLYGLDVLTSTGQIVLDVGAVPLPQNAKLKVEVTQDSGGNEPEWAGLLYSYGVGRVVSPSEVYGKKILARRIAGTSNVTSGVWSDLHNLGGQLGDLESDKEYAILGSYSYSANSRFHRFTHPSFMGCKPGGPSTTDVALRSWMDYKKFGELPVFKGDNPAHCEVLAYGAETVTAYVLLAEL